MLVRPGAGEHAHEAQIVFGQDEHELSFFPAKGSEPIELPDEPRPDESR